ncbi:MAG: TRAP transporter permease, partial [Syntrophorhabdus sp.]
NAFWKPSRRDASRGYSWEVAWDQSDCRLSGSLPMQPPTERGLHMPEQKTGSANVGSKFRKTAGLTHLLTNISLSIIPVIGTIFITHIPEYLGLTIYKMQYVSLFLTLLLSCTFLTVPATKTAPKNKIPWYDLLFIALSIVSGGYVAAFYPSIVNELGILALHRIILGFILIGLVLEATRRIVGWPLVIIGVVFALYAIFAYLLPGMFHSRKIPYGRVITYMYLSSDGVFGIALSVVSTIVFSFIFFGRALFSIGGGQFLSDLAMSLMGRYRGGPAKVAILASSLFGSLSGSASANVAMTGIITIPLMKRVGYQPHIAGAIEAVASTGGLILPPIMAATAFIIAEFLEIPYSKVAISALVPALLYYVAVFAQVHLQAVKGNFKGISKSELPSMMKLLKEGWLFFVPVVALLYCLFGLNMMASTAGLYAVGATILIGLVGKKSRAQLKNAPISILTETGRGLLEVGIICAVAGIVVAAISITGLGLSLSTSLVTISGGNILILLIMAAIGAIILGMGMPVTATYLMLVVLIAPALIKLGIEPLAAHLFIMYFGIMSFVTPPVAIAAYVAAGIAGSEPMRTGFAALRLGIVAYIVPFIFCFEPGLLLLGSTSTILLTIGTALLGTIFLAVSLEGYLFLKLNVFKRLFLAAGAFALLIPDVMISMIGFVMIVILTIWELVLKRQDRLKEKLSTATEG